MSMPAPGDVALAVTGAISIPSPRQNVLNTRSIGQNFQVVAENGQLCRSDEIQNCGFRQHSRIGAENTESQESGTE